jgi:DnaJ-domain-containing protein 1
LNDSVKPTLFLLASALALADQEQSKGERSYLKKLSQDLDLSEEQVEELRRAAGQFIVEQCIALNSDPTDDEVARLARLTELSIDDVLRVMVRRRKRAL